MDVTGMTVGTHHGHHHDPTAGLNHMAHNGLSEPSSPESNFDETDLFNSAITDAVTAQLVAAGTVGIAAAAAIATGRKRKRPHAFETNPAIRKRQQTRLLRKLKATIEEYTTRVGQQAIILTCMPGKQNQSVLSFKVFGSQPLENVIRNCKNKVMQELETALITQAPVLPDHQIHPQQHELPPLHIDGIPTPVDKMTQAQLRAFIPEMLKFSTGRSKPGWGKPEYRPIWWPMDVPWANVRSDVRSEDIKKKVSWTHALKTVVKNCYKHHNREDLLPQFHEDPRTVHTLQQPHTMLQTISNPDGSMSIIQIDPGDMNQPHIVTLSDGTQAQIVHAQLPSQIPQHQLDGGQVNMQPMIHEVSANVHNHLSAQPLMASGVDLNGVQSVQMATYADATVNQDGQLVLSSGDGTGLNGVVSIPMSVYQINGQNIQVINPGTLTDHQQHINTVKVTQDNFVTHDANNVQLGPMILGHTVPKTEHDEIELHGTDESSPIEVVTIDSSQMHHSQMHHHDVTIGQDSESDT